MVRNTNLVVIYCIDYVDPGRINEYEFPKISRGRKKRSQYNMQ